MNDPCPCGEDHPPRASYFVSATRDDGARSVVCGPYTTHEGALAAVDAVRRRVCDLLPEAWWYGWGTCGSDDSDLKARWSTVESIGGGS